MADSLNMSLDDIIKKSNNHRVRGRGGGARGFGRGAQGRGRGGGGGSFGPGGGGRMAGMNLMRRGGRQLRVNARPSSFNSAQSIRRTSFPWQNEYVNDSLRAAGMPALESGTKLFIFNLDYGVSNEDIRELFSEMGELRRYAIHYDKNGRPSGSAEVVYERRSDAFGALKRYNNVLLDGKPMKIEVVGAKKEVPVSARMNVIGGVNGRRKVVMPGMVPRKAPPPAVTRGFGYRNRGGARGGRGRGLGRGMGRGMGRGRGGRTQPTEKSADELNKELDNYHAEAMQT